MWYARMRKRIARWKTEQLLTKHNHSITGPEQNNIPKIYLRDNNWILRTGKNNAITQKSTIAYQKQIA